MDTEPHPRPVIVSPIIYCGQRRCGHSGHALLVFLPIPNLLFDGISDFCPPVASVIRTITMVEFCGSSEQPNKVFSLGGLVLFTTAKAFSLGGLVLFTTAKAHPIKQ
ncbi:hypothetical protein E6O75_ATG05818 [Venturia nashicola]|uniref:Uncharacterized protein n=1 Tax=Venturia nashicola TaxID=86259 RepID=A0A4Z1NVN0_9PEZI|nr:hypothetical protein E6O75_ATG05818 [Venturia nashicola]